VAEGVEHAFIGDHAVGPRENFLGLVERHWHWRFPLKFSGFERVYRGAGQPQWNSFVWRGLFPVTEAAGVFDESQKSKS
jgi:hypothetical protein